MLCAITISGTRRCLNTSENQLEYTSNSQQPDNKDNRNDPQKYFHYSLLQFENLCIRR